MTTTTHRKSWCRESMKKAIEAIQNKEMGYKLAARSFNVPRSTLKDYIKKVDKTTDEHIGNSLGRKPVFSEFLEKALVNYCLHMEKNFYGVSAKDLKTMAFKLALQNNLKHPFSTTEKKAGTKWLKLFLKRHPNLSFRKPQALSRSRAQGFTRENVKLFFSILKPELVKVKFNPTKVYNVDETGISTVQHKMQQILTRKGKKEVHKLSSAERGTLVTVVTCMSAAGQFVPPLLVFPRKNKKAELLDGTPPGSIAAFHPSGWIQNDIFVQWLVHFIENVKPTKADPVVLILDGHYSHTRNLDVINMSREHGISIVCLPPHSTNKMQPLDVSFMFSMKTFYAQEIVNWLDNHPGRVVTHYQVGSLLGKAYLKAATPITAINGFRKTGILPYNENIFTDADFNDDLPMPSIVESSENENVLILPAQIHPVPHVLPSTSSRGGSAIHVTGSPHKKTIVEAEDKKKERGEKVAQKRTKTLASEAKDDNQASGSKKIRRTKKKSAVVTNSESEDENDYDTECPYCSVKFSEDQRGEKWIRCVKCFTWAHEDCSDVAGNNYTCTFCINN